MEILEGLQKRFNSRIQIDEPLTKHTSFKIGGPAKYFFEAKTKKDIIAAVQAAEDFKISYFVLSRGGNILVADSGFDGLAIKIKNTELKVKADQIEAGAGLLLGQIIQAGHKHKLVGMEFVAGIPGSLGGAIWGNAGAYRKCMADLVEKVEYLEKGKIKEALAKELGFAYRESMFKKNKAIILSVVIKLKKGDVEASKKIIREYIEQRGKSQPLEFPSAGCIFKNIELKPKTFELKNLSQGAILEKVKHIIPEDFKQKGLIPAGWIIDEILGLKGMQIGDAKISEKHANFIVNLGKAKAEDVMILMSLVKQKARNYFGVQLQEEVELVGF